MVSQSNATESPVPCDSHNLDIPEYDHYLHFLECQPLPKEDRSIAAGKMTVLSMRPKL